ncbi:MAG: chorion class high-cysteine HCB protein 13 [Clostridia bacterium]
MFGFGGNNCGNMGGCNTGCGNNCCWIILLLLLLCNCGCGSDPCFIIVILLILCNCGKTGDNNCGCGC